jgi:hypothetical protein
LRLNRRRRGLAASQSLIADPIANRRKGNVNGCLMHRIVDSVLIIRRHAAEIVDGQFA